MEEGRRGTCVVEDSTHEETYVLFHPAAEGVLRAKMFLPIRVEKEKKMRRTTPLLSWFAGTTSFYPFWLVRLCLAGPG